MLRLRAWRNESLTRRPRGTARAECRFRRNPQVPAWDESATVAAMRASVRDMRVEESIEISRSPEEVWAFVGNPANDPKWCPKVKAVEAAGERRWRVTHKPVPLRPPIELMVEHLAADAPSRLSMREEDDAAVFQVEYRLERDGSATRFTQISEFDWKRLPRFLHGTFRRGVERDVRRQLRELKRVLEPGRSA